MKLNKNVQKMVAGTLASSMLFISMAGFANAAALGSPLSDTQSSLKVGTPSNHEIKFKTMGDIVGFGTITIIFSGDTDISNVTAGDISANVGGTWSFLSNVGQTLVVGFSGGIPSGTDVVLTINNNKIINDTTSGVKNYTISTSIADTGIVSVNLIPDDTVAVSATVDQTITFAISENVISFGELTSANPRYANITGGSTDGMTVAHTVSVATNASSGYSVSVKGDTLTSQQNPSNTITSTPIGTVEQTGTEQFGINVSKAAGSLGVNGVIDPDFDFSLNSNIFSFPSSPASAVTFASGSTPTDTETYNVHYLANIGSLTEAGSYSTNLVYVATANF